MTSLVRKAYREEAEVVLKIWTIYLIRSFEEALVMEGEVEALVEASVVEASVEKASVEEEALAEVEVDINSKRHPTNSFSKTPTYNKSTSNPFLNFINDRVSGSYYFTVHNVASKIIMI